MRGCECCGQVPGELAFAEQWCERWLHDNGFPGKVFLLFFFAFAWEETGCLTLVYRLQRG